MIKCFDASDQLVLSNPLYKADLDRFLIDESIDITTESLGISNEVISAQIIAKSNGLFCGESELRYFLSNIDVINCFIDGAQIKSGDVICEFKGPAAIILKKERPLLNFLMRVCGIATFAHSLKRKEVMIVPTRKTLWGLLDKKACSVGGCGTHRLSLNDAILIKENHLKLVGTIASALQMASQSRFKPRFMEIEVTNEDDAKTAYNLLNSLKTDIPRVIMFDNMSPEQICSIMSGLTGTGILFEASGGINKANLDSYLKTGVDVISMSQLTMDAPTLDLSLLLY